MDIDEIGHDHTEARLCRTDGVDYCNTSNDSTAQLNWYSPDGSVVVEHGSRDGEGSGMFSNIGIANQSFAVNRSEEGVRLFHSQSPGVSPIGLGTFCCTCDLPGIRHSACVDIRK